MKYLVITLFLVLCSCVDKDITKKWLKPISIGKLVKAEVISTSFNESQKMLIETDEGIYVIVGITSFKKGEVLYIVSDSRGYRYIKENLVRE